MSSKSCNQVNFKTKRNNKYLKDASSLLNISTSNDRPREKLLYYGANALSDSELLAILLKTGTVQYTVEDVAKQLLLAHGSLRDIFSSSLTKLCKTKGIGQVKALELLAVAELCKRLITETKTKGVQLNSAKKCIEYLSVMLRDHAQEHFACLFLSNQYHLLAYKELFYGNINSAPVYTGEIVRLVMDYNAVNLIVAHNHPSGDPKPSDADLEITKKLKQSLALIDVNLVDHIIVGHNDSVSLAEKGML